MILNLFFSSFLCFKLVFFCFIVNTDNVQIRFNFKCFNQINVNNFLFVTILGMLVDVVAAFVGCFFFFSLEHSDVVNVRSQKRHKIIANDNQSLKSLSFAHYWQLKTGKCFNFKLPTRINSLS